MHPSRLWETTSAAASQAAMDQKGPPAQRNEGTKGTQALVPDSAPRTVPSGGRKRSWGGLSRRAGKAADHVQAKSPPVYEISYFISLVMTAPRGGVNGSEKGALGYSINLGHGPAKSF